MHCNRVKHREILSYSISFNELIDQSQYTNTLLYHLRPVVLLELPSGFLLVPDTMQEFLVDHRTDGQRRQKCTEDAFIWLTNSATSLPPHENHVLYSVIRNTFSGAFGNPIGTRGTSQIPGMQQLHRQEVYASMFYVSHVLWAPV